MNSKLNQSPKKVYIYDGSYQGLLTALYWSFKLKEIPIKIISESKFKDDLFYQKRNIKTDIEKAEFLSEQVKMHISSQALHNIFRAYLSEVNKIELYIFRYLFTGFKVGKSIDELLTKDYVLKVQEMCKKVGRESHRFKGLIRLQETVENKYYAAVEPDYKILILIASHFKNRFSTMDWIIHDLKREEAIIFSAVDNEWLLIDLEKDFMPEFSKKEEHVQELWRSFFRSASIKNKKNAKIQQQFMPKKYWNHLIEKPGSSIKFKLE
jgi:probable DNA metabolism protein